MRRLFIPFCLAIALLTTYCAQAATYFVKTNGNDSADGLSVANAWLTGGKAASTVAAGDIVYFLQGAGDGPALFNERISISANGTPTAPIIFVATNHWTASNITVRAFNVTGDNVWVVGFQVTQTAAEFQNFWPGINYSGATNGVICDNYIHHTQIGSDGTVQIHARSDKVIFRGNILQYSGTTNSGLNMDPHATTWHGIGYSSGSEYHLIEFNAIANVGDFLVPWLTNCIYQGNVLGTNSTNYANGGPHIDGLQCDGPSKNIIMRNNWHVDNIVLDSHFVLIEAPVNGRNSFITVVNNLSLRSGDQLWYQMRDGTNLLCAHNTVGQVGFGPRGGPASSGFIRVFSDANGAGSGEAYNNIFTNVTTSRVFQLDTGTLITNHNLVDFNAVDMVNGVNGDIEGDPKFVDYAATNCMLQTTSPAKAAGGPLTVTTNAGTGNVFGVSNVRWFTDGMGLTKGDHIYVGDDLDLVITNIDYTTYRISVSASFTWGSGDNVGYKYRGAGPDMGCYRFGDTFLTGAAITHNGNFYTCTVTGDCYMVVFYTNGIPQFPPIYESPYTNTLPGFVTAKAYSAIPQQQMVFNANDLGSDFIPTAPGRKTGYRGLRLRAGLGLTFASSLGLLALGAIYRRRR